MAQLFSRAAFHSGKCEFSISRTSAQLRRRGFTLVEVLVAMAITLLIMATIVTVFNQIGTSVADSRASIEMSEQVQGVRDRLQRDLGGLTVTAKPWLKLASGSGYLEIIEGPRSDLVVTSAPETGVITSTNATTLTLPNGTRVPATALGDFDDILMFTSSDPSTPFYGRGFKWKTVRTPPPLSDPYIDLEMDPAPPDIMMVESNDAEIVWYSIEHPVANQGDPNFIGEPGFRTIYRRALIVAPGMPIPGSPLPAYNYAGDPDYEVLAADGTTIKPHRLTLFQWYQHFDVSVRRVGDFWVPNSLSDLTWRQNRFAHDPTTFPYQVDLSRIYPYNSTSTSVLGPVLGSPPMFTRQGEDIMLRNALAFDVRVYDPQAPLRVNNAIVVSPGDPGWALGTVPTDAPVGAFVDLNYNGNFNGVGNSWFAGPSQNVSTSASLFTAHWDTWPFAYEQDGIDQDGDSLVDEGINGFDDNSNALVDEPAEYETQPPYIAPMRGVLVRLRGYEPYSRQVRDVTVVENFVGK